MEFTKFKLSGNEGNSYNISFEKVANGVLINVGGKRFVYEGTPEEIKTKIEVDFVGLTNFMEL